MLNIGVHNNKNNADSAVADAVNVENQNQMQKHQKRMFDMSFNNYSIGLWNWFFGSMELVP